MTKKLYLETVGCQMNVLDSELVVGSLRRQGYELTHEPTDADVILFNTCSVRQHAEDKIYSALGRLRGHKHRHPSKIIGVLGCMAQKDQELIRRRAPHVDIVCGTGQLARLPELIDAVRRTGAPQLALSLDRKEASREEVERSFESYDPLRDPSMRPSPFQAYVRVQVGCGKFCSYFIVGFSGETEASFQRTCDLVREARFKNSFIFKYSPRPGTKADERFADDVPEEVKKRRNNDLLAVQAAASLADHRRRVGETVEVLVEGPSKTALKHAGGPRQLTGRTMTDHIVVFAGNERLVGQTV